MNLKTNNIAYILRSLICLFGLIIVLIQPAHQTIAMLLQDHTEVTALYEYDEDAEEKEKNQEDTEDQKTKLLIIAEHDYIFDHIKRYKNISANQLYNIIAIDILIPPPDMA